ncbi:nose resistant to fluoxetine protein 6-like [Melanaphis sacchari]|uniref:nose resistant to fluoxetine protein 6-like n=1 Tax=Melanaphis sacchari TaxID=742174 RepID=UPI000DC13BD3|nr:nose resistant to fluoxetine protein 6-like [Melanaphis sacchari]XP_025192360.1 nose resistant to fluoxetine protein 6-like [Melanaphis sacchari]XP_025192361.1 nose resistant to fluoxetine protein 6-like [Melanaphis sacchari]
MSRASLSVFAAVALFFVVVEALPGDLDHPVDNDIPKTWIANIFYEALVNFTGPINVGSTACRKQTEMYTRHLKNDSLWAVQMSDSWSRYPNGLLVGASHQMGVYEECIKVQQPIKGKYCMPSVKISSSTGTDFAAKIKNQLRENDHAWYEILGFVDRDNRFLRNVIEFGICIPDSCNADDLQVTLQKEFDAHFLPHRINAQVQVESISCSTDKDEYPYDNGFYLTSLLVGFIFLLCCLSTAYHMAILIQSKNEKTSKIPEIFSIFSFIRNFRDLIKYNRNNDLNVFNGLKVLTMILVLFGHKFLYFIINPITYAIDLEKVYKEGPDFLLTCMNLIDPFFYIAGFLLYVMLIPQFNKPGTNWYQIVMVIVYKYLKVLPSYLIVMLMTTFIIPHMGNGPFWAPRIWPEAEKCKNYWWANLLAISNFIPVENQCLIAGWYVSCLLQFLVIGTILVYVYVKNRKIGTFLFVMLLCISLATSFVITYTNRVYGIIRVMVSFLKNPSNSTEFSNFYRQFYYRGTPFYAGLLAGVVVDELKKREIKFSTSVVYVGTLIVSAVCVWVQLYGAVFHDVDRPYNVLEQSVYAVLSHCTWTVILFWITVCHFTTGYGPIEKLFNNRLTVPLGRLSYTVYLVNITVMMMIESKQKTGVIPSSYFLIDGWIVGAMRTYMVGTLLYLIIDAPSGHLIKKLLFIKKNEKKNCIDSAMTPNQTEANNVATDLEQKNSSRL